MRRHSTSLIIRETQIKTSMRDHLILGRISVKKDSDNKCWKRCKRREPLLSVSGKVKFKKKNCHVIHQFHFWLHLKGNEISILEKCPQSIFITALFIVAKIR
jgi:hypothetical protein